MSNIEENEIIINSELLNNDFDNSEEFINQLNNNLEFLRLKIQCSTLKF